MMYLLHRKKNDIYANISLFLSYSEVNWTELEDAITKFINEMPSSENWVLNLVILHYWHTIFQFWYCAVAWLQFVLFKALYK